MFPMNSHRKALGWWLLIYSTFVWDRNQNCITIGTKNIWQSMNSYEKSLLVSFKLTSKLLVNLSLRIHLLKCITETYVKCTLVKPFAKEDFAECGDISFHPFVVENYLIKNKAGETTRNKDGKVKIGSRTVRKTFVERFEEF